MLLRQSREAAPPRSGGRASALGCRPSAIFAALLVLAAGCTDSSPTQPPQNVTPLSSTHFELELHDGLASTDVQDVVAALEANYQRILDDLQVGDMPRVTVGIWSRPVTFYAAMEQDLGQVSPGSTGYVTGVDELCILLNAFSADEAVHEFVHNVSLKLNPGIVNNPRWLWEAVAVYESGGFVDPSTLFYMQPGEFPTLDSLNALFNEYSPRIYEVGYVLVEYIVRQWGMDAVVALIRANGDVAGVLALSVTAFEQGWYAWLEREYLESAARFRR